MQPERHRRNQLICNINVAGFVSVMLALLWLFMSPAVLHSSHRWVPVDLPKAGHPISMHGADREDAMIVAITRDGKVFFRSDRVWPNQLPATIRECVKQGSESKVYVIDDAHAKYEWVAEVLDGVQAAGIEKIGFLVNQRRSTAPSPQ